ncbi:FAD binding domain-containing protein [Actinoplanes sp. NBRC 101535]|uniref:FAD binding domain-containing protein n=1 Tax=Actinoplanes sp. NBRC 101535 TaxID=3032196 RepID=UPI0024A19A32|nr:FAD binding domain-containing protein [Actinoplanes sp. NBRC 101535]GLY06983.1 carbon monoxide dehydrogenase [Actinoplanes sp. NBRC 101535]
MAGRTVQDYIVVKEPDEAIAALADGDTAVLAGGQSLVLDLARRANQPARLVDINRVAAFDSLAETGTGWRIGPLVRHRTFETEAVGGRLGVLLRRIVRHIGHPPIRARGTMLGSLAYAHPAAEWTVLAAMLGARLELAGPDGIRPVAAGDFFTGPFSTVRRPDELLAGLHLDALPPRTGTGYAEVRGPRAVYAETAAMAAVTVADGVVVNAAIGLVNAGPCPVRARAAERALIGGPFRDRAITTAAERAAEEDATFLHLPAADRPHLRLLLRAMTRRALTQAREEA